MRGRKSEQIVLQKMLRYCDEIEQILRMIRNFSLHVECVLFS